MLILRIFLSNLIVSCIVFYCLSSIAGAATGDIDGNDEVNLTDAILSMKVVLGENIPNINLQADVNEDQKISLAEAIYILRELGNQNNCTNGQCGEGEKVGVNISWFNTWNESQPLANVGPTGRGYPNGVEVDSNNQPNDDFNLIVYEGSSPGEIGGAGGGAQTGLHQGRFTGQAALTADGGTLDNVQYDSTSNTTTFTYTTTAPTNSIIHFNNTRRNPSDSPPTGIKNLEIMRPGHTFDDLLNSAFVQVMEPFSAFRVGPNWEEWTYQLTPPIWANRAKPDGMYSTTDGVITGGVPWETLIAMANEMQIDLWICLPPNADDNYLTKIFQTFLYGSDGITPYSSPQQNPEWSPLDPALKLYFEVGNEIWNYAPPYGSITTQVYDSAVAEIDAGDPNHFAYASADPIRAGRRKVGLITAHASQVCRNVVGDSNMMSRFRPVLSGQSAWPYIGLNSISYLKCVLGGHDWIDDDWSTGFPGQYKPDVLITPEDGVSINQFGNVAHPLSYWIYGYAVAPYVNGESISELTANLNDSVKGHMSENIAIAIEAGIEPLAYEGGIESYHSYQEEGLDTVIEELLNHWYSNGGGLFMYYALAGNTGSGLVPDLTRQDPAVWPKIRAIRKIAGLDQEE